MSALNTPGLVLRHADYGDYDRMVTLFTPENGRLDAIARGCRRAKSPLVNAVEPFTSGIYQLYSRRGRMSIDQCEIKENFYPLRTDYDRLVHGAYWLRLLEATVVPDVPAAELFLISLKALAHLSYSDLPPALLTMAFELHLMAQLGFSPRMDACVRCGRPVGGDARFDASLGGAVCLSCPSGAPRIDRPALLEVEFKPDVTPSQLSQAQLLLVTLLEGLRAIERGYPRNVRIIIEERRENTCS